MYGEGSATPPYFAYNHAADVVAGDGCVPGDSSISALSFYSETLTPAQIRADMRTPITAAPTPARAAKRTKGGANVKRYRGASRAHR